MRKSKPKPRSRPTPTQRALKQLANALAFELRPFRRLSRPWEGRPAITRESAETIVQAIEVCIEAAKRAAKNNRRVRGKKS